MTDPPTVLITGASTGIGMACALHLDRSGWRVFAGVRRDEDATKLSAMASTRLEPIRLEVTDPESISAAAERVFAQVGEAGLHGLVNNAGIAVAGPLEFIPMELLCRQLEVNVIGHVRVIQAFLPLVRRATGRILNMSSTSGLVALPAMGPYAASKFALEALSDSLRVELRPWGIKVILIEPGSIATPIWERSLTAVDDWLAEAPPELLDLYGKYIPILRKWGVSVGRRGLPVERVSEVVTSALTVPHPKARYIIVGGSRLNLLLLRRAPEGLRDRLIARRIGIE